MRFKERDQSSVRAYQRISLGKRKRLVELVISQGQPLSKIVKKLKIKLTTARLIITKYRQTGEFPMRDFKKRAIKERHSPQKPQQPSQTPVEQSGREDGKSQNQYPVDGLPCHPDPEIGFAYHYVCFSPSALYFLPWAYN